MLIAKLSGPPVALQATSNALQAAGDPQTTPAAVVSAYTNLSDGVRQAYENYSDNLAAETDSWAKKIAAGVPTQAPGDKLAVFQNLFEQLASVGDSIDAAIKSSDPNATILDAIEGRASWDQTALLSQLQQLRAIDADFQKLGYSSALSGSYTQATPQSTLDSLASVIKFVGYTALGVGVLFIVYKIVSSTQDEKKARPVSKPAVATA